MSLEQIENEFQKFGTIIPDFEEIRDTLKRIKALFVEQNDEHSAKATWIYETILQIHDDYFSALRNIYKKNYYEGWCKLERVEVEFSFLERHFNINDKYLLTEIKRSILQLQCLYPYKIFTSMELLEKRIECTICQEKISPRSKCPHVVGEIYSGEICLRRVTEMELLGIAIVENPHHKYTVLFIQNDKGERIDYRYELLDYWNTLKIRPFQYWNLVLEYKRVHASEFGEINPDSECPCDSGNTYSQCCSLEEGILSKHYIIEFDSV